MTNNKEKRGKIRVSGDRFPATFIYLLIMSLVFALDQLVKVYVRGNLVLGEKHRLIGDWFSITYFENTGAAFSSFSGKNLFLLLLTIPALLVLLYALFAIAHKKSALFGISLSLIAGGGIGNLIDRLRFESVTDYFDLKHFAIFNLADVAITVGCGLLIIWMLLFEGERKKNNDQ